ncbi:hypothetical protein COO60DRAFT_273498 [Scenedesmus sp. NREL 46B-D3]|nr:hypothetical protein COO60DRAFT_273498 [Scenedesmus sp. NREL 46B-D3]
MYAWWVKQKVLRLPFIHRTCGATFNLLNCPMHLPAVHASSPLLCAGRCTPPHLHTPVLQRLLTVRFLSSAPPALCRCPAPCAEPRCCPTRCCARRYCNTYPLCISLLASKRVDVAPMITHRFAFSAAGVAQGFDTAARAAQTGAIKVMFDLQQQQQQQQQGEQLTQL